ncbi:sensor histidine kinase [Mangrovimonas sp. ST2L15]|uniref:sensor histidine kinase n=1 Tax=Mangrovimonas sp. ST2L15 TaxID=1645916 RepID=UPI0006B4A870|nr:histidine kinase [Mangrovimonas sp. ST2L15]
MNINIKNKGITIFFHALVWVVLFSFPYLLSSGQDQVLMRVIAHSWVPLLMYAALFYVNYLILVENFFYKRKIVWFLLINAGLIALCIWSRSLVNDLFFQDIFPKMSEKNAPPKTLFIYVQILSFLIPIIFSLALKMAERYLKTEADRQEAEKIKLESELQHLKYQLQPHFFFNSLNNIYSLVDISPDKAKSTIHSLSKLMRYLLYETNVERVTLNKEIQFIEKYIELMKLRLTDRTKVSYQFPEVSHDVQIAPLLFISLVENAFKHGVSSSEESRIHFEMHLKNDKIIFETTNRDFPKTDMDKSGSGIGLLNIEKRLRLLYPNKYTFRHGAEKNLFKVKLMIDLND